jgi:hypothetical protein
LKTGIRTISERKEKKGQKAKERAKERLNEGGA